MNLEQRLIKVAGLDFLTWRRTSCNSLFTSVISVDPEIVYYVSMKDDENFSKVLVLTRREGGEVTDISKLIYHYKIGRVVHGSKFASMRSVLLEEAMLETIAILEDTNDAMRTSTVSHTREQHKETIRELRKMFYSESVLVG